MVKKFNRSNFKKQQNKFLKNSSKDKEDNHNDSDMDEEDAENFENQKLFKEISEGYIIIEKLNSPSYSERESITSLLASQEFNLFDTKIRDQLLSIDLCRVLVDKLTDPYIQIRYNSISAIINLIFCFSENEIDSIFFLNTNLFANLEFLLNENNLMHLEKNKNNFTQNEMAKNEKLIKNIWELLLLAVDLYDESKGFNKINFDGLIKICVINLISSEEYFKKNSEHLYNKDFINLYEEIFLKSNLFIANLASVKSLKISEFNHLKEFMEFAYKILSEFENYQKINILDKNLINFSNTINNLNNIYGNHAQLFSFLNSSIVNTLFYLFCANSDISINLNIGYLISKIFMNIDFNLSNDIEEINNSIQNFVKNINKEDKNSTEQMATEKPKSLEGMEGNLNNISKYKSDDAENNTNIMKKNLKNLDFKIKLNNLNLKTVNDVITQIDIGPNSTTNLNNYSQNNIPNEEDDEEISEEEINSNILDDKSEIERQVSFVIANFFGNNFDLLKNLLNENFLNNLSGFFNNLTIEEFVINDFDKMILIKEGLYELEYNTLSILNNLIYNFEGIFGKFFLNF